MITLNEDKKVIKAILDTDPFIERAGFKAKNIKTTKASAGIVNVSNPDFQIHISIGPPEGGGIDLIKNIVYKITVSGNRAMSNRIDEVTTQVIALLHEKNIGRGHVLQLLDPPMELDSDPGVYIVETTFLCESANINVVRK